MTQFTQHSPPSRATIALLFDNPFVLQNRRCPLTCTLEASSENHCCRGKAVSITHFCARARRCVCMYACLSPRVRLPRRVAVSVCKRACTLAYPVCKQHVPYCRFICGLSGSTTFFDMISQTARFSKKATEHKMYNLISSTLFI